MEKEVVNVFKNTISEEIKSMQSLINQVDESISDLVGKLASCKGKIVVSGIGKSGLIGRKISSTLSSTGTRSIFLHSTEAFHGDLGMIDIKSDFLLLLSNSGETEEVIKVLHYALTNKIFCVSITGNKYSTLATKSNFHIEAKAEREACILNLAPMSSTTLALVVGDAIANSLMHFKNFMPNDFLKFHPGGALGKRLVSLATQIMKTENLPILSKDIIFSEALNTISGSGFGVGLFIEKNKLIGLITDGDLRRLLEKKCIDTSSLSVFESRITDFKFITENTTQQEAIDIMNLNKISILPVLGKNNAFMGLVHFYDLTN